MKRSAAERLWARVPEGTPSSCWIWPGAKNPRGYGHLGGDVTGETVYAHRVAYESKVGPIPEGHVIDHRCGNVACVNPRHLRATTQHVNVLRAPTGNASKTHCKKGHPFDVANTYLDPKGWRYCRACNKACAQRRKERRAAARPA